MWLMWFLKEMERSGLCQLRGGLSSCSPGSGFNPWGTKDQHKEVSLPCPTVFLVPPVTRSALPPVLGECCWVSLILCGVPHAAGALMGPS